MPRAYKNMYRHTRVVFRAWPDGDVIALFPNLGYPDYTTKREEVLSYESIGQHGAANYELVMSGTRPARPEEYKDLFDELAKIGYVSREEGLLPIDKMFSEFKISLR